jgi:hypothetical protein
MEEEKTPPTGLDLGWTLPTDLGPVKTPLIGPGLGKISPIGPGRGVSTGT